MLQYAVLYLTGYPDMTIEQIKRFRQLGSKTPGHPEYGHAPGVEATTGPLGQGLAMSVGMAIAETRDGTRATAAISSIITPMSSAGDGCLMEGVSHEAIDLAGHLKLAKLIVMWDNNRITIDGATSPVHQHRSARALRGRGLAYDRASTATIRGEIEAALKEAQAQSDRPTLIACRTTIGFGAPNKQGTQATHGAALGAAEVAATRKSSAGPTRRSKFRADMLAAWRAAGARGARRTRGLGGAARRRSEARRIRARDCRRHSRRFRRRDGRTTRRPWSSKPKRRDAQILGNGARA